MCGYNLCLLLSPEDVKRLSNKLVEVSTSKLELQMKLDELESSEVSIKVMIKLISFRGTAVTGACLCVGQHSFVQV